MNFRLRPQALAVAAVATAMIAAACGQSTVATPTPSASPSPGAKVFKSAKFTTVVPTGWSDETGNQSAVSAIHVAGQVLMLLYTNSPTLNEHIDVSIASQPVTTDQLGSYLQSVSQNGATNLSQPQSFNLDGSTGIFITYNLMSTAGSMLKDQDMVINHGSDTYDIVLNTAQADFDHQKAALQAILAAWKWMS
jgi:hypothetical protein